MQNVVIEDKIWCVSYSSYNISGELALSLQFSSNDKESHALSISRSIKWTHQPRLHY